MNRLPLLFLLSLFMSLINSCGKTTTERTRLYNYTANPAYTGSHPTADLSATVYLKDKTDFLEFQSDLQGVIDSNEYQMKIHAFDSGALFGYAPLASVDLGVYKNNVPVVTNITSNDFSTFTSDFKGYFIVTDPNNVSSDPSTFLFFGKIGTDW